jgi:inner membrane protein
MSLLRSPAIKMVALGFLLLVLLIPLLQVQGLIDERRGRAQEAESSIAAQWGQAQTLATPWLLADFPTTTRMADGSFVAQRQWRVLLADDAEVATTLVPEIRYRGMFEVPVYTAKTKIAARFARDDVAEFLAGADAETSVALRIGMSDARGLRALDRWEIDGTAVRPAAASRELAGLASIGHALARAQLDRDVAVDIDLTLAGVRELRVLPFARNTRVAAESAWPNPSFLGAYLPAERTIGEAGFRATWQVLELNRDYGQSFGLHDAGSVIESGFGVELYTPADVYQQNERSGKYGILMVALVFVALFLFEIIAGVTLHPVQYLLIGLALALFYLLLLALSEHFGFAVAYLVAAGAAVALVATYARAVLGSWRRAGAVAALQASAYGVFFVLVRSEDHALLLGATTLFAALALLMYLTRRFDWSNSVRLRDAGDAGRAAPLPDMR